MGATGSLVRLPIVRRPVEGQGKLLPLLGTYIYKGCVEELWVLLVFQ